MTTLASPITISDRVRFAMMSFVHETLYGLIRDPVRALKAAGIEAGQRVLEVGCGPGFFTIPAARLLGDQGSLTAGLDWRRSSQSTAWLEVLERHNVRFAVLHRRKDRRLISSLLADANWTIQFLSPETAILSRRKKDERVR